MLLRLVSCLLMLCLLSLNGVAPILADAAPRVFILDAEELNTVRERVRAGDKTVMPALEKLIEDADRSLGAGPYSVTFKKLLPPSGDKHDYMSLSTYWWPNPDTPDGLPYVRRDGYANPEGREYDVGPLQRMMAHVDTLALAYYLTGQERYAEHAAALLKVWFLNRDTRMNPHLTYAQGIPGVNEGRGIGVVDTRNFVYLMDSIGILETSGALMEYDKVRLRSWFRAYLTWLLESTHGEEVSASTNNIGTWFDAQLSAMALYVGDDETARRMLAGAAERRIMAQIEPDGHQPRETRRTRSLSYSLGNLRGMINLARLAEHVDVDLWNYETEDGRSIRRAIDFLLPHIRGEKEWEHEQIGNVSDDIWMLILRRAANGYNEPEYETALRYLQRMDKSASRVNLQYPARQMP